MVKWDMRLRSITGSGRHSGQALLRGFGPAPALVLPAGANSAVTPRQLAAIGPPAEMGLPSEPRLPVAASPLALVGLRIAPSL
jgi:hypothetical protein